MSGVGTSKNHVIPAQPGMTFFLRLKEVPAYKTQAFTGISSHKCSKMTANAGVLLNVLARNYLRSAINSFGFVSASTMLTLQNNR
jgi:hypothetical protein